MKLRNVLTVLGTAAVTAAATLALFAPWGGDAQAGPAVKPVLAQSQLASQGCTFTLKTDKEAYEAGDAPKVEVTATNPTDKPVTATVSVVVTSTAPTSPMSRMLPIPVVLWSHEYAFTVPADGKQSLTAECAGLPAAKKVAMTLTDQQNAVLAGIVGVPSQGGPNYQTPNAAPNAVPGTANKQ